MGCSFCNTNETTLLEPELPQQERVSKTDKESIINVEQNNEHTAVHESNRIKNNITPDNTNIIKSNVNGVKNNEPAVLRKNSANESEEDEPISKEERERMEKELAAKKLKMANNLRQRVSISAESYGRFNQQESYTPKVIPKTEEQKTLVKEKMLKSFLFKAMDDRNFEVIINALEEFNFQKGEVIIKQGDPGSTLFLLDSGEAECFRTPVNII